MSEPIDREVRLVNLPELEIRDHSGRPDTAYTVRGYAAVYNQTSHDLGGFREQIAPGAFDAVLASQPDVGFVWDHDTRYIGARTTNGTLKLESDDIGLRIHAQVGNYSWAQDLRTALKRGDINQGSFAFTVAQDGDEFAAHEDGTVMRTIHNVGNLFDVTVTAQGAYPQTSMAAVRSLAKVIGRSPESLVGAETVAEDTRGEANVAEETQGEQESQPGSVEDEAGEPDPRAEALRKRAEIRRGKVADLKARLEKL